MQRLFHGLVNGSFGDPGLYLECAGGGTLFDCGDLKALAAARIHRVRDLFLTHAHVDHFFGFDWLLRLSLGADRHIRVFGPEGIAARVFAKLDGYTWNIDMDYAFDVEVHEVRRDAAAVAAATFVRCHRGLERRTGEGGAALADGVLVETQRHRVRAAPVDHDTPCLAFRYEQRQGLHVDEEAVARLGLARGPWIKRLKTAVLDGHPHDEPFDVDGRVFPLGALAAEVGQEVPGTTVAYVSDTRLTPAVAARLVPFLAGADVLYCEAKYAAGDHARAAAAGHLTTTDAARLAREASAGALVLFHASPRYQDDYGRLLAEARAVFPATRYQRDGGFLDGGTPDAAPA